MIEELSKHYDEFKKVLDILPTNFKSNISKKIACINDEYEKDNILIQNVKEEIERRISVFDNLVENEDIKKYKEKIEGCNIVYEWNNYNTSYEKMHLDYYLYQLNKCYKEDLESVNSCIRTIIDSFKMVGINLKKEDFSFNSLVASYIEKILDNSSEQELKKYFEEIYWKNSDIIKILEINIKSIYLKNEKKIDKYYEARHNKFLKEYKENDINELRIRLSHEYSKLIAQDKYLNFKKFLDNTYQLNIYKKEEIEKKKNLYFEEGSYNVPYLEELYNVLEEYNVILKYKYLFDDIKSKLQSKDTLKNAKAKMLKELSKVESKLVKLNSSQNKKSLFGKAKNDEKWLFNYKEAFNEVVKYYDNFEQTNFDELVYSKLTQDSTVLDALNLITSNYIYFVNKTIEQDDSRNINEIDEEYNKLKDYVNCNNFIIINNIALLDEKQLKELIVNKYNLENISITKEALLTDNLSKTMEDITILINNENIILSGINVDDVYLYIEYKKMNSE